MLICVVIIVYIIVVVLLAVVVDIAVIVIVVIVVDSVIVIVVLVAAIKIIVIVAQTYNLKLGFKFFFSTGLNLVFFSSRVSAAAAVVGEGPSEGPRAGGSEGGPRGREPPSKISVKSTPRYYPENEFSDPSLGSVDLIEKSSRNS